MRFGFRMFFFSIITSTLQAVFTKKGIFQMFFTCLLRTLEIGTFIAMLRSRIILCAPAKEKDAAQTPTAPLSPWTTARVSSSDNDF
jgi:hypothetical protein